MWDRRCRLSIGTKGGKVLLGLDLRSLRLGPAPTFFEGAVMTLRVAESDEKNRRFGRSESRRQGPIHRHRLALPVPARGRARTDPLLSRVPDQAPSRFQRLQCPADLSAAAALIGGVLCGVLRKADDMNHNAAGIDVHKKVLAVAVGRETGGGLVFERKLFGTVGRWRSWPSG
jgi:hypothetical protein